MNPKRLKGLGSLATVLGIYSYFPYIAAYLGSSVPILTACAAGFYGMLAFREKQVINSIGFSKEEEHSGKLEINVALSPLASVDLLVNPQDVMSITSLPYEGIQDEHDENHVVMIKKYVVKASGEVVDSPTLFSLKGEAFLDRPLLDWVLSKKEGEDKTGHEF